MTGALQVVVMGVSGTGKSAIGTRAAEQLAMTYIEGDSYHPRANVEKMSAGQPLTDEDRQPWLEALADLLAANRDASEPTMLACSALRRRYRDVLRGSTEPGDVVFVHLEASFEVLLDRMEHREHFMPASLLQSQLDTLEPLEQDERGAVIDVDAPLPEVVAAAVQAVRDLTRD